FEGSGTAEDPYLIASAADFKKLTDLFCASTSSSSPYGAGLFFLQTADVDMTGAEDYEGTHANGNAKCYFGGVYNGGGHTLTVSIEAEGQTSVFPYIYGAIVNLKIKGSINSDTSAQPIRTVQSGAVVANCLFDMVLTSSNANAVTYTNYGTVYNVYAAGVATHAAHSSNNGKYYNAFTNVKNASGTVITTSAAVSTADPDTVVAGLSDRESSAAQSGLAALRAVSAALDASALEEFHVKDGEPAFGAAPVMHGDVNRDGALSIEDVTALLDLLATGAEALSRADLNADGRLSIDDVTALLDLLAGGVPNPEEVLLSQEDLALYRGSYNILSDRITDRGFAITSLNGAYIGMFTRDSSIQAMAHIANGDDGAARRILRYLLSYHAALDLKRGTHVIEELREEEYRNNYLEGNGSGEEDAVYDLQTETGVAQFLVNAPNNTSATPFTTNRRTVTEVSAYLEGVADAEVVAEICEDPKDPSTVLAAGEHVFENSAPGWVVFTLDEAFLPEKGETYYLKIYAPAGNGRVVWYGVNNGTAGELRALNYDLAAYGGDGWREVEVYTAFAIGAYGGGEAGSAKIAQRAAEVGIYSITAPDHGAAQAFIPQNAYIYSVEAHLDKSSDGDVVKASIRTDYSDPSTTLGEALYTFGARENGWQIITFDEPVQVTPGKTCYLVLQAVNAAGSVIWNGTLSAADVPNSYNYDVPSFGGWVEKPYHPAFEIVSYPASAVARGFEARGGLVTGVGLTVFSAEAGGRIRAEIRTDYRYPSSALCSAEAAIDAAGEKTYTLSFGSVAVTAGGRYYLVVFLEGTEDRARLLTDTRAEADTWALGGAWEKIGYDFLATLNFEVDKAPLITLDGAAAGVQEIPASGELITTVKVLLMKDPGAAGTLKATLYKGENVEIDVKTLDLAAVPESPGWVTVSFDLPLFKTPEAGSYFVKLETVGASGKVYWCGSTTVDTLDTYTLTNGTKTAVPGEAGFEALRASLRLYSDYTQTDTTYMLIHAWAMFANKAKKTDENLKFIVDSYPLIKSFANYFIDDPAYMNDSLDLLYNPSLEHSKQGRYWQSYDLITNVFASQALWELSAIAGTMDDATASQKWLAAARRIEGGINAHLVTDYEGKTIYGEFYDSFDGMTFYPGISWVNFAPVAAEWYAMDVEIMKNTYEVYKEYAGITMLGYPGLSTDATLGADDKRDSLIGKGVAWELMFCDRIGDTDRVKEILALERATAEKYALSCYPESWISQYQVSDPGNQEHCAWQVYAMCAVFPELKSANG
ncbi:MAG: dockerin type I repeat-containing protein, partial [Clostridia bacterium]|nr:dockerin type I repeat-containing protein [Clostridia bacterium]